MSMKIGSGYLYFIPYSFNTHEITFEEKAERIQMDLFKKKYPIWQNIEEDIEKIKSKNILLIKNRRYCNKINLQS